MNNIEFHPWKIIQNKFDPEQERFYESIFSIGNGKMGQRANMEEHYSGDSMQGSYIAGLYYPDKTRVGWWKNGYPEYFAKVINSVNWIGIDIKINGERLDLAKQEVLAFRRELDMQYGTLLRKVHVRFADNTEIEIESLRFCSLTDDEIGCIQYQIKLVKGDAQIICEPYLDNHIVNEDSNYDEIFWEMLDTEAKNNIGYVQAKTKKLNWITSAAQQTKYFIDSEAQHPAVKINQSEHYVGLVSSFDLKEGSTCSIHKFASILSNLNVEPNQLKKKTIISLNNTVEQDFDQLLSAHSQAWLEKWEMNDIQIDGDVSAQQAIRFNIFQLNQTYTGEDARLNIGPKGFTGEKYGGSTYWDTEAYCIPFYLATADPKVARNLLIYRHNHLQQAIDNAKKLGFKEGAALYPMVTMNGEECHNEWEITFEEIHRNGAIAFAIFDYIRYTDDWSHIPTYGLEVLIAISRFWAQRVNFSKEKGQYVMLGVTGPNEYENNINNNWYTNYIAVWSLNFTQRMISFCASEYPEDLSRIVNLTNFDATNELPKWKDITSNMYFPYSEEHNVFLQQDGFLDKELQPAEAIPEDESPIWKHWSWDRILRSCYIKQADVLQGMFLFEDDFDKATIERHFDFYEPMTVHESSLSPCIHAIQAALIGRVDKAYELYMRTARLDLDNMNDDTDDGCHITSMAGTWMSVVKGFGGMRIKHGELHFNPIIPKQWKGISFKINFRQRVLYIACNHTNIQITHIGEPLSIHIFNKKYELNQALTIDTI